MNNSSNEKNIYNTVLSDINIIRKENELLRKMEWINTQTLSSVYDMLLTDMSMDWRRSSKNPLANYGKKCFSQNEEDGITLEILRRLGITGGTYAEYGVGNGLENNTLVLANLGWRGYWVGGENLAFDVEKANRLCYIRDWITLENIYQHTLKGLAYLDVATPDVVSLDLDGNDYYFVDELLKNKISPSLFIVEYNAKFFPPAKFCITYDPTHQWDGSDYFGAALMDFVELFASHEYRLVCCNQTGSNAFFIKEKFAHLFSDVPTDISDVFVEARYYQHKKYGHPVCKKTIEKIMS